VVKKRVENAGPVGEVDVWAHAAVAIVPAAAMIASVGIALRILILPDWSGCHDHNGHGRKSKRPNGCRPAAATIESEISQWAKVIKEAGIKKNA